MFSPIRYFTFRLISVQTAWIFDISTAHAPFLCLTLPLPRVLFSCLQRCGRLDDQILLLQHKLDMIQSGNAFNGKRTKTARSQGKKFQVSIEQEATRLLVNKLSTSSPVLTPNFDVKCKYLHL